MKTTLAIDGGGTCTRAGLYGADGALIAETEGGPSNPIDLGVPSAIAVLRGLAEKLIQGRAVEIETLVVGLAGVGSRPVAESMAQGLLRQISAGRILVTNDLSSILHANWPDGPALLVVAGTGSCVMGRSATGQTRRAGGRGPLIDDQGSAYHVALGGLRAAAAACDDTGPETVLTTALLAAAGLDAFDDFKAWGRAATRRQVAGLAPVVTHAAEQGDTVAQSCVEEQARLLAGQALALAKAIELDTPETFTVHGGMFTCRLFLKHFKSTVTEILRDARIVPARIAGHAAAYALAETKALPDDTVELTPRELGEDEDLPPTEAKLDAAPLDTLTAREIAETMGRHDAAAAKAASNQAEHVARTIDAVVAAFGRGGRLVYIGAGTSGRLGVLDAAECPPTFGVEPGKVVAIIAGGGDALRTSVEGAEDETERARVDLDALDPPLNERDLLVGITASGQAPYVLAALQEAARRGATSVLVCCNPQAASAADITIALDTGPEVVAGSTRLKAGTATKMVLNQISTGAMALSGYVYDGLMVHVKPVNEKLRRRAIRIVSEVANLPLEDAAVSLETGGDSIPVAVLMARYTIDAEEAQKRLDSAGGSLRAAL